MWDVDAICWWADQVNFGVSRVLHIAQATESHNNVQRPSLPTVVIDHYSKVLLLPLMSRPSPSTTSLPMSKDNTGLSTTL